MDCLVSRKEKRWQPVSGQPEMVLVEQIYDFYPHFESDVDPKMITDITMIADENAEVLDRALFAMVKQRGQDPVEIESGIQWAETIMGDVPAALVLSQVKQAVQAEGPGVQVEPYITPQGTAFKISLAAEKT